MKRSPMKRSPPPPRREAKQIYYTPRPRAAAVARADAPARMVVPVPKDSLLRADAYLRLVASLSCAWCGIEGYSQAAHSNFGKALGQKTSDATAMPLCADRPGITGCHSLLDQGGVLTREQRRELEALWGNQTRMKLRALAAGDADIRRVVERTIGL